MFVTKNSTTTGDNLLQSETGHIVWPRGQSTSYDILQTVGRDLLDCSLAIKFYFEQRLCLVYVLSTSKDFAKLPFARLDGTNKMYAKPQT